MFFLKDCYAYVNEVKDKGNYSEVRLSTTRKDTKDGNENKVYSNWSFVRFVGKAHNRISKMEESKFPIKILTGQITQESYTNASGEIQYPKNPSIVIFDFETSGQNNSTNSKPTNSKPSKSPSTPYEDDGDLPF